MTLVCPQCWTRYPDDIWVCPEDGAALEPLRRASRPTEVQGAAPSGAGPRLRRETVALGSAGPPPPAPASSSASPPPARADEAPPLRRATPGPPATVMGRRLTPRSAKVAAAAEDHARLTRVKAETPPPVTNGHRVESPWDVEA